MDTEQGKIPHPSPLPRKRGRGGGFLARLTLLFLPTVTSADAMRCGSRVINEGDSIDKVQQYCGEPAEMTRTYIERQPRFEVGGQEYSFPGTEEVPVDLWTYDFGPNKLMRRVRMIAGKVDSIETLEHGKNR
jgi:hypothetical protein